MPRLIQTYIYYSWAFRDPLVVKLIVRCSLQYLGINNLPYVIVPVVLLAVVIDLNSILDSVHADKRYPVRVLDTLHMGFGMLYLALSRDHAD